MNIKSAKAVQEFVRIAGHDRQGRPNWLEVPGHRGHRYFVKITRPNGHLTATCWLDKDGYGQSKCPAYAGGHICYHILAAVMVAAKDAGYKVSWCNSRKDAKRLSNLPGKQLFSVRLPGSGAIAYGAVEAEQ